LGGQIVDLFVGISKFLFGLAPAPVGLFEEGAGFFELVLESVGAPLRDAELFTSIIACSLFFFKGGLDVLKLLLVLLDCLLGFRVSLQTLV
jgi:hypothetical protein